MGIVVSLKTGKATSPNIAADADDKALAEAMGALASELMGNPAGQEGLDLSFLDPTITDDDFRYLAENLERMNRVRDRIGEIAVYLFNELRFPERSPSIWLAVRGIIRTPMARLSEDALLGDRVDWKRDAVRYAALALAYRTRMTQLERSIGLSE
jgi:hypothetical protein